MLNFIKIFSSMIVAVICFGFLTIAAPVLAITTTPVPLPSGAIDVNLSNLNLGVPSTAEVGGVIGNIIRIVFYVALILVLIMLIFGAVQWIISGGEKEAVGNARNRITHALIGLAILALAFIIVTIVGRLLGVDPLNIRLPRLF